MVIVESGVGSASEVQHAPTDALGQLTRRGSAAIAMGQRCRGRFAAGAASNRRTCRSEGL